VGPTDALADSIAASEFEWFGLETAEFEAVVAEASVKFLGFWNGSVANFHYGYSGSSDVRLSCSKDGELLGDGRIGTVGIPRLSLAHHVDHLDIRQRRCRACE
jgi:hypothetical protein